jgi:hypothetical protein
MTTTAESTTEQIASQRRRIRELEVMVAETIVETHDTATIKFFTGNDRLEYQAGHFLTLDPHDFPGLDRFTPNLKNLKSRKEAARFLESTLAALAAISAPPHISIAKAMANPAPDSWPLTPGPWP